MKKHSFWSKVGAFLTGRGFYMVLILCLAAIGGSGWFLWREYQAAASAASAAAQVTVTEEDADPVSDTLPLETEDPSEDADDPEESADSAAEAAEDTGETLAPAEKTVTVTESEPAVSVEPAASAESASAPAEPEGWLWPLEGEVAAAFSTDTLTYNEALGDWRTHEGVDLSAGLGDEVISACDGTVLSVEDDLLLGTTVTVDCGGGVTALYGNLAEECDVMAGDEVSAGTVLGVVGTTALGEQSGEAWLHFAVQEDGVAVDPMTYLN